MNSVTLGQAVPFIHPAIAAAALACGALPVIIHLINRRRYKRVPWAAMSFLLAAHRRSAKRLRLEHWLLLLVRIAIVIAFGLAIARPYLSASALVPASWSRSHRILMIDNSLSMSARLPSGGTRFDLAKKKARDLLQSFGRSDAVSLVTLADPADAPIATQSYDRRNVREALTSILPTQRATDFVGAAAKVIEILRESEAAPQNRVVYLITDLARRDWVDDSTAQVSPFTESARSIAGALADSETDFVVLSVAREPVDNVAVTDLACDSSLVNANMPVRVSAKVRNFGPTSSRNLKLQLRRDGEILSEQALSTLEPGAESTATASILLTTPGIHVLEAHVSGAGGDGLSVDDTRFLSLEARETIPLLIIDGRPGSTLLEGQAGYLAMALAPEVANLRRGLGSRPHAQPFAKAFFQPKVITKSQFDAEVLGEFDVLVLCNVPRLSEDRWLRIQRYVRQGGGLLLFGGGLVSIDNYNRFAFADGKGLLPCRIGRADNDTNEASATVLAHEPFVHPIMVDFADHPDSGLFLAHVNRYHPVEPVEDRGEILVRFADGNPALIASSLGKGRILFCTTTAGMDWNNLAAKGDYVSLMLNVVSHLSTRHGRHRNVTVGRSLHEPLTATESSLQHHITNAAGESTAPRLVPVDDGLTLEFGPVELAGVVTVMVGDNVRRFAVNVDTRESDLTPCGRERFVKAVDRPLRFVELEAEVDSAGDRRPSELATPILCGVLLLLAVEMWLANRFGSQRLVRTVHK